MDPGFSKDVYDDGFAPVYNLSLVDFLCIDGAEYPRAMLVLVVSLCRNGTAIARCQKVGHASDAR